MRDLWRRIKNRFIFREINKPEAGSGFLPTAVVSQNVISYCIQLLKPYSAGTVLYVLDCLCPGGITIKDLCNLDLSQPHQHEHPLGKNVRPRHDSHEELLTQIRAYASIVPAKDYPQFWSELTMNWLLTCPTDPDYYREGETGKELYCQRLRSELIDRILRID